MSYLLVKWIHILSATILFGAGVGSAFHMFMANRQGRVEEIYFAARTVVLADYLFTSPAIVVQLLSGAALVDLLGYSFTDFWIASGLALYAFAGACWLPVVRIQIEMRNIAKTALETGQTLPERYWKMNRWWIFLGSLAFPALIIVFYLMVFRPDQLFPK